MDSTWATWSSFIHIRHLTTHLVDEQRDRCCHTVRRIAAVSPALAAHRFPRPTFLWFQSRQSVKYGRWVTTSQLNFTSISLDHLQSSLRDEPFSCSATRSSARELAHRWGNPPPRRPHAWLPWTETLSSNRLTLLNGVASLLGALVLWSVNQQKEQHASTKWESWAPHSDVFSVGPLRLAFLSFA